MVAALVDCVHGRAKEKADGLVDVCFGGNWREGEFGERFCNSDNGLELTDSDGDGGSCVGFNLGGVDLSSDGDEVRGQLLGGLRAQSRSASSKINMLVTLDIESNEEKRKETYVLQ